MLKKKQKKEWKDDIDMLYLMEQPLRPTIYRTGIEQDDQIRKTLQPMIDIMGSVTVEVAQQLTGRRLPMGDLLTESWGY